MKLDVATLKKRLQIRAALAITIESGRIAVDLVRRENGGSRVVQSFTLPLGADAVIADPQKAGEELVAQLEAAGIRERRCVVCLPPSWALTTSTDVPAISADDLRGFLELRAESEFPMSLADLRLAHCAYVLPDGTQRATIAAIPTKRLEAVERMLETAGCRAVSISLGLDACLSQGTSSAGLHFIANGTHVDVVIAAGGGIAALRSLPAPAANDEPKFDAAAFSRELRITLGRLPEAVRQQVRDASFSGSPSAEILRREIQPHLGRMGIDTRGSAATDDVAGHSGSAIDAAEHHLRQQPVIFEFVAPQTSRWQAYYQRFDSRRRRWIVAAVVLLVVLPASAFMVRSHIESSLEVEWKGMGSKVTELDSLQQKIRQFRPWFDSTPQSLQLFEALVAAFPEQGDVWAKSVHVSEASKVTCSGFARNQAAFLSFIERLRGRKDVAGLQVPQQRGENPIQFSITYRWEPRDAK